MNDTRLKQVVFLNHCDKAKPTELEYVQYRGIQFPYRPVIINIQIGMLVGLN